MTRTEEEAELINLQRLEACVKRQRRYVPAQVKPAKQKKEADTDLWREYRRRALAK